MKRARHTDPVLTPVKLHPDPWIEGIFDGLACVESHSLAGCDLDGLSGLWIPPFACGPRRHIENAKSGDTDRIPDDESIENGITTADGVPLNRD